MANLEGMKLKFILAKHDDISKYLTLQQQAILESLFESIEHGRKMDGKDINKSYLVINTDEPYADEVIGIMKRHGHWG